MTPNFAMTVDPWILAFSAVTVIVTIYMGFWSAKKSKTASDFYVAGRSVSVGWNASAISGEYLSAASFMGIAGMVMSSGYDALWYPVCYACGYLFLLLFIAGPLRRFGAYTIPDFAEGRFDSPVFRKIAVVFVLFIGFFYTMPQMKGAGTTLAYIFPGLPYWAGVVLVGAVITLNVALGGMKGITLVQAFQYWAKMFAISVPIFVLMAVYGHYGKQLRENAVTKNIRTEIHFDPADFPNDFEKQTGSVTSYGGLFGEVRNKAARFGVGDVGFNLPTPNCPLQLAEHFYTMYRPSLKDGFTTFFDKGLGELGARQAFPLDTTKVPPPTNTLTASAFRDYLKRTFATNGLTVIDVRPNVTAIVLTTNLHKFVPVAESAVTLVPAVGTRKPLPEKAPADSTWLSPFGPLTTKAAKAAAAQVGKMAAAQASGGTGYQPVPSGDPPDGAGRTTIGSTATSNASASSRPVGEVADRNGQVARSTQTIAAADAEQAWLAKHEKPYALLYTYSLIIALVCGTAGLPHILVRFYTNPDGVAAKRTTMWVMILIGIFYVFPPVFGVMGRNLLPELYAGVGAKGTDKVVLELPRILNSHSPTHRPTGTPAGGVSGSAGEPVSGKGIPWGSILSGITCAGAFAAFMSTFSGLLVSMTGALAHDVYGRMFRPKSTPEQRLRMFKVCAVLVGGVAIVLGCFVEPLEINFMVGQAFAIAAASYFPLLFMSVWWRGMTMKGAAIGMLTGGLCALGAVTLTNVSNLALDKGPMGKVFAGFAPLNEFWAQHPLLRILCEQPAIWTVPLAIGLMIVVGKLTRQDVPSDVRMKMLVLHAPEKLGLKQEYIQEHQAGH